MFSSLFAKFTWSHFLGTVGVVAGALAGATGLLSPPVAAGLAALSYLLKQLFAENSPPVTAAALVAAAAAPPAPLHPAVAAALTAATDYLTAIAPTPTPAPASLPPELAQLVAAVAGALAKKPAPAK